MSKHLDYLNNYSGIFLLFFQIISLVYLKLYEIFALFNQFYRYSTTHTNKQTQNIDKKHNTHTLKTHNTFTKNTTHRQKNTTHRQKTQLIHHKKYHTRTSYNVYIDYFHGIITSFSSVWSFYSHHTNTHKHYTQTKNTTHTL